MLEERWSRWSRESGQLYVQGKPTMLPHANPPRAAAQKSSFSRRFIIDRDTKTYATGAAAIQRKITGQLYILIGQMVCFQWPSQATRTGDAHYRSAPGERGHGTNAALRKSILQGGNGEATSESSNTRPHRLGNGIVRLVGLVGALQ
jgi:hypothetical protein